MASWVKFWPKSQGGGTATATTWCSLGAFTSSSFRQLLRLVVDLERNCFKDIQVLPCSVYLCIYVYYICYIYVQCL